MEQEKLDAIVAGVVYQLLGWMTARPEPITLSSGHDAQPAAEAAVEFFATHNVDMMVEPDYNWQERCSGFRGAALPPDLEEVDHVPAE